MKISPKIADWNENGQNASVCSGSYFRKMDNFLGLFERKDRKVYRFRPLLPYPTRCREYQNPYLVHKMPSC